LVLPSAGPVFQGKRLGAWMDEVDKAYDEESPTQLEFRREVLTNVVRSLDGKALACARRWLWDIPRNRLYDKVQDRIESASGGRIHLPEWKDRTWEGMYVIQILGPAAQPAIPDLSRMLTTEPTCYVAIQCLPAIGPAAFPAISNAVAVGSGQMRREAMRALGELGPAAEPSVPLLLEVSRTAQPGASFALRALVEVSTNAASFLPLLQDRLTDPAAAPDAAYALARIGEPGLVPLLRACTNSQVNIRAAAMAALDPQFRDYLTGKVPSGFDHRSAFFGMAVSRWSIAVLHGRGSETHFQRIHQAFRQYSTKANASVRSEALAVLGALEAK
jgi:hypothetical protein